MSEKRVIAIAFVATASTSLILAGILFYFFYRYSMARNRGRSKNHSSFRREAMPVVGLGHEELMGHGGTLRGLLVEENGRDVLYLRKADGGRFTSCFSKVWFNPIVEEDKEMDDKGIKPPCISSPTQEIPLISMADHGAIDYFSEVVVDKPMEVSGPSNLPPPPPPRPPPPPVLNKIALKSPARPPPPPLPNNTKPPAPPPPAPPPLPPVKRPPNPPVLRIPAKRKPGSSLPPPLKPAPPPGGFSSSLNPPAHPRRGKLTTNRVESLELENPNVRGEDQMKLKPLHWDKVHTNAEYSMVWHEITDGSFR